MNLGSRRVLNNALAFSGCSLAPSSFRISPDCIVAQGLPWWRTCTFRSPSTSLLSSGPSARVRDALRTDGCPTVIAGVVLGGSRVESAIVGFRVFAFACSSEVGG